MADTPAEFRTARPKAAESDPTKAFPTDLMEENRSTHDLPASERLEMNLHGEWHRYPSQPGAMNRSIARAGWPE